MSCFFSSVQFISVTQSCPTLCNPMDCSTPGTPVRHQLLEFTQLMSIESVMPSNHLILCRPLLLPPSIFPSIRVFSSESALRIRWPFPSPGDLCNPGVELRSPTLQADSLPAEPQGKPKITGVGSLSLLQWIFPTQESNEFPALQADSLPTELWCTHKFYMNWEINTFV